MPGDDRLTRLLDAAEAAAPVDAVQAVTREVGIRLSASAVSFLIADMSGRALVRLAHVTFDCDPATGGDQRGDVHARIEGEESAVHLPFGGGPMEDVVRTQRPAVLPPGAQDDWTVLAPVTERGEVIGVLELRLPAEPAKEDVAEVASLAHLLAFVVIANRRHTDLFEWGQRSRPMSLSAEIQQRLLPGPRTCEAGAFTLSGWLEPAADIAGDTFDFSLARDTLHLSLTDAMGHGVAAALTATLCVGELRGARRRGQCLVDQALSANASLVEHGASSGSDDFVTGVVARLDLTTGSMELVNAGHVPPYLARDGEVGLLELPTNIPFGMFSDATYDRAVMELKPGDRLVFVTDGMLERNAEHTDLSAAIHDSAALHPREAARFLADRVLAATGHALSDDATVLCLDWLGSHEGDRTAVAGADLVRASGASSG